MNFARYPWLARDLDEDEEARERLSALRERYVGTGAVVIPEFLAPDALREAAKDARAREGDAFTTDDVHTAYQRSPDLDRFPGRSVYNHEMRTRVASTAYDELHDDSALKSLYRYPILRKLVAKIVGKDRLYLSEDPLGCCSINVFRPGYYHSFHFDEAEFSTTLMLQEAGDPASGLFQYTDPLRQDSDELALDKVAAVIDEYDNACLEGKALTELRRRDDHGEGDESEFLAKPPALHTLDFRPGTLSIFSGSRSLHRVTQVEGDRSRLVAVLTFAPQPGFRNSRRVQEMFWGRSVPVVT